MKYIDFQDKLSSYTCFSLQNIKIYFPNFDNRRLVERQKKGYINKIIKGRYHFTSQKLNDISIYKIANKIQQPSYLSCEIALQYYGLIPEGVYLITSVTNNKTSSYETNSGYFHYYCIKNKLFFGYDIIKIGKDTIKIANKEKAVLDFLYLKPNLKSLEDFIELRIDADEFWDGFNQERRNNYLNYFNNKELNKRANILLNYLKQND